jgi:succinyl-CoA synthetase beta subunit
MRLLEHQGRNILQKYDIPIPKGLVATNVEESVAAAERIGYPVVIKAQVLAGGRGKAGGIKFACNKDMVHEYAKDILGMSIKSEIAQSVLITEKTEIAQELYAGITIDSERGLPILLFSVSGGIDIEEVAKINPEKVLKLHLCPTRPLRQYAVIDFLRRSELEPRLYSVVSKIVMQLIDAFYGTDATTAEINPLVITAKNEVLALDAKVVIDDSALKRQNLVSPQDERTSELETRAKKIDVNYVPLDGNIAVIAGGAGLAMATMDLVSYFKAKPASFLDTGGGISSENMAEALRISLATPGVSAVVINVFGGINNCEVMAKGIANVLDIDNPSAKIVVKMRGHSQDEGWKILEDRKVPLIKFGTSEEAVQLAVELAGRTA